MTANSLSKGLEARRKCHNIFQVLNNKHDQLLILYLTILSFIEEGKMKEFSDKRKLRNLLLADLPLKNG